MDDLGLPPFMGFPMETSKKIPMETSKFTGFSLKKPTAKPSHSRRDPKGWYWESSQSFGNALPSLGHVLGCKKSAEKYSYAKMKKNMRKSKEYDFQMVFPISMLNCAGFCLTSPGVCGGKTPEDIWKSIQPPKLSCVRSKVKTDENRYEHIYQNNQ